MAKKRKRSSIRDRVKGNAEKQQNQSSAYGYLQLPKGVSIYIPTPGKREDIDILLYEITDEHHMDIDEENYKFQVFLPYHQHIGVTLDLPVRVSLWCDDNLHSPVFRPACLSIIIGNRLIMRKTDNLYPMWFDAPLLQ